MSRVSDRRERVRHAQHTGISQTRACWVMVAG